jgi:hypothetical protein
VNSETNKSRSGKSRVPKPPSEGVKIRRKDLENAEGWMIFFRNLPSDRVRVIDRSDESLPGILAESESKWRSERNVEKKSYSLIGWPPKPETIVFAVWINTSPDAILAQFNPTEVYVFCLDDRAFCITHFGWDGDAEEGDWAETYSLRAYTEGQLRWDYIKELIVDQLRRSTDRIPPPPK